MAKYVFIESRDPFESNDTQFTEDTAISAKARGHEVMVYLVQNAVLAARKSLNRLGRLTEAGVTLLADDFSLRERGIDRDDLAAGIQRSEIGALVDAIVQVNTKAIWH